MSDVHLPADWHESHGTPRLPVGPLALADRRMLHEKHGSRLVSGHAIKAWIEKRKDCVVSLEESRYDG